MAVGQLELDLDVFSGPFDLLLSLILREEVDLMEVELADLVLAYLEHLEGRGELELEVVTEFIVLVAALLELKSRLLLAGDDQEELDLEPAQAADELLARLLEARRYRRGGEDLARRLAAEDGVRYRVAPVPPALRRRSLPQARAVYDPGLLGAGLGSLLRVPASIDVGHLAMPRVTVAERLAHLRGLLSRLRSCRFDDAVRGEDRITVAMTLFALLELYKEGEASWDQEEPFGEITIRRPGGQAPGALPREGSGPPMATGARAGEGR